jgi:hypothetical protein
MADFARTAGLRTASGALPRRCQRSSASSVLSVFKFALLVVYLLLLDWDMGPATASAQTAVAEVAPVAAVSTAQEGWLAAQLRAYLPKDSALTTQEASEGECCVR